VSELALPGVIEPAARKGPDLSGAINPITGIIFGGIIAAVLLFVAYSIYTDIGESGTKVTSYAPFLLLFVALLIALGFEFVNGFHDTANAVATVIYTRSLPANFAVVWSGMFNLAGVLASSGAVAFGIISLLPVELILQVGSSAGFAMVFARGRSSPAVVDSRNPHPHLHAGELLPRFQRWAKRHGPDHADPDRHGADGLCTQSRHAGK
jgi:inorganic phosphate transporter, PiT family